MAQKYTKKYLHTPSSRRFAFHSSSAIMFVMSYSDTSKGPMMSFTIYPPTSKKSFWLWEHRALNMGGPTANRRVKIIKSFPDKKDRYIKTNRYLYT